MRTILDLPEDLIEEAMKVTGIPTNTRTIITALKERHGFGRAEGPPAQVLADTSTWVADF